MRAADAVHDDPVDVPDQVYRAAAYEADISQLRARGCRCPLRCVVNGSGVRATPLSDAAAMTCPVDHGRS